jgi:hypothetical protein
MTGKWARNGNGTGISVAACAGGHSPVFGLFSALPPPVIFSYRGKRGVPCAKVRFGLRSDRPLSVVG